MSAIVEAKLRQAYADPSRLRDEFSLVRVVSDGLLWEDHLSVQGNGEVRFMSKRSLMDVSGQAVGWFQTTIANDELRLLLPLAWRALSSTRVVGPHGGTALRLLLHAAIDGTSWQTALMLTNPRALEGLEPLLWELDRLAVRARQSPVATCKLALSFPQQVKKGTTDVSGTLTFTNSGYEGLWLVHPGRLNMNEGNEHCRVIYGKERPIHPGVTPLPMETEKTNLSFDGDVVAQELWLAGGAALSLPFLGRLNATEEGTWRIRAEYSSYVPGNGENDGRRFRGCIFSNELKVEVCS